MTINLGCNGPLLLVGCGKMGTAMLTGWLSRGLSPDQLIVQEPDPSPELIRLLSHVGITPHRAVSPDDVSTPPAIILMAVKPQILDGVYTSITPLIGPQTLMLSVAAGRTIQTFEQPAPAGTAVIRSIPNTPAAVGRGMTVCCANAHVTAAQRNACETLLSAIGEIGWVDDEALIDAATAVSGSGPAYLFYLTECLAQAGVAAGLDTVLAQRLALATVTGAGELMHRSHDTPTVLRQNVTSPNGTTQAALDVLMRDKAGLDELMREAVAAAANRSRQLSS